MLRSSAELLVTPDLAFLQFLLPALIGAAGSVAVGALSSSAQRDANRANAAINTSNLRLNINQYRSQLKQQAFANQLARRDRATAAGQFERQMEFAQSGRGLQEGMFNRSLEFVRGQERRQKWRADTAIRRLVRDARAAGLHPLAAMGAGGSVGSFGSPVAPNVTSRVPGISGVSSPGSFVSGGSGGGSIPMQAVTGAGDAVASAFDHFGRVMAAKQQLQASEASQIRIARERHRLSRERMQEAVTLVPATSRTLAQRARRRAEDGSAESRLIFEGEPRGIELHTGFRKTMPPKTENMGMYDEMNDFIDRAAQDVARDVRGVVSDMREFREAMAAKMKRRRNRNFGSGRGNY